MKTGFEQIEEAVYGLKEAADKMMEEAIDFLRRKEINAGKASDVNERLKQVFTEKQEQEMESYPKIVNKEDRETIQKHWSHSVVFTDAWCVDTNEQKLTEEELQPGELWAVTFRVGCYIVRGARRLYKIYDPGYSPEMEMPADKEEVEHVKKDIGNGYKYQRFGFLTGSGSAVVGSPYGRTELSYELCEKLRDTLEISARHISSPSSGYTYICRTADARNFSWSEKIESIYTVKEHDQIPDEYASLLVCMRYLGSSFSSDTWYKLEPTGKITTLRSGAYGIMDDDARFS
ncbi:MAG: hypothetical protein HDR17_02535 [Lachnospiraceae bacterium]|nr:hypothetical protein [Lachnospiraceae bacterium]